jgi:hypothetical protein
MASMPAEANKHTSQTSAHFVTMYTSIKGSLASAVREANIFASDFQKAKAKVWKDADTATKAVQALQKAIDALKDKTITITTKYKTVGSPACQHGGIFMQGGGTVVDHRQKIGGVTVGEWNKQEELFFDKRNGAMMVNPLTDPNNMHDRGGSTIIGNNSGGNSQTPIINITLINRVDGNGIINDRELAKRIKLEGGKNYFRFI